MSKLKKNTKTKWKNIKVPPNNSIKNDMDVYEIKLFKVPRVQEWKTISKTFGEEYKDNELLNNKYIFFFNETLYNWAINIITSYVKQLSSEFKDFIGVPETLAYIEDEIQAIDRLKI